MANPATVVHVFLDDTDKAVSIDDVKEWLQILDDVTTIKLQFDAATRRPCYYVEFRRPTTAQQAVQYLNGARLKNCVVTIQSRVYAAAPPATTTATSTTGAEGETRTNATVSGAGPAPARKRCRESSALPHNHQLPPDLQMDAALADLLPVLDKTDATPLWKKLQHSQAEMVDLYSAIETATTQLHKADEQLSDNLHAQAMGRGAGAMPSEASPPCAGTAAATTGLRGRRLLCHRELISFDALTLQRVVSVITETFGPLTVCSEASLPHGALLTLRFLFAADEERFLAAATAASAPASATTEWRRIVRDLGWTAVEPLASPVPPHRPSLLLQARVQDEVRALLS